MRKMRLRIHVLQYLEAAWLRQRIKRQREKRGLSTDLKSVIAEYRALSPEYARKLESVLYPPFFG